MASHEVFSHETKPPYLTVKSTSQVHSGRHKVPDLARTWPQTLPSPRESAVSTVGCRYLSGTAFSWPTLPAPGHASRSLVWTCHSCWKLPAWRPFSNQARIRSRWIVGAVQSSRLPGYVDGTSRESITPSPGSSIHQDLVPVESGHAREWLRLDLHTTAISPLLDWGSRVCIMIDETLSLITDLAGPSLDMIGRVR